MAQAFSAFLFGVAVAAPVGPIAMLLIRSGLNQRLSAALAGAIGVALADLTYAVTALLAGAGLSAALRHQQHVLEASSSLLLILLGVWLATAALLRASSAASAVVNPQAAGLTRFYLLTLTNPLTIVLFVGFAGQMQGGQAAGELVVYAGCLFLGSLVVQMSYASFGAFLQQWLRNPASVRVFNAASGVAIAAFGVYGLLT